MYFHFLYKGRVPSKRRLASGVIFAMGSELVDEEDDQEEDSSWLHQGETPWKQAYDIFSANIFWRFLKS